MKLFKKYGSFLALLLGVVAIVMLFIAPALYSKDPFLGKNIYEDINAFQTIFGNEKPKFDFNVLGFVALVLLVVGLVFRFLPLKNKFKYLISAVLLLLAGIFLFIYPSTISKNIMSDLFDNGLGAPLIVAGILSILAALIDGSLLLLDGKKTK